MGDSGQTAADKTIKDKIEIKHLLQAMVQNNASDLHLTVGVAPTFRIHGKVTTPAKLARLTGEDTKNLIYQVITEEQRRVYEKTHELDFSFEVKNLSRFRINLFYSRGERAAVFRTIPIEIPSFEQLGLPPVILDIVAPVNGLFLVTGPTGSGKSTTLSSIIDWINREYALHIVTLEDPIEFYHPHKKSIVNQREIGRDSFGFKPALRGLLRQDPDVVFIGELRDLETMEAALEIAETGHLVFATLHTNSTVQTISRIINAFPSDKQEMIRILLSFVLQGVVSQQLVTQKTGGGRSLVLEIFSSTSAMKSLIRENKLHQMYSSMQMGQDQSGMITMNQSLIKVIKEGKVDRETALTYSPYPQELVEKLKKLGVK